jgi:hypothetical protein
MGLSAEQWQETPLQDATPVVVFIFLIHELLSVFTFNSPFGGELWTIRSDYANGDLVRARVKKTRPSHTARDGELRQLPRRGIIYRIRCHVADSTARGLPLATWPPPCYVASPSHAHPCCHVVTACVRGAGLGPARPQAEQPLRAQGDADQVRTPSPERGTVTAATTQPQHSHNSHNTPTRPHGHKACVETRAHTLCGAAPCDPSLSSSRAPPRARREINNGRLAMIGIIGMIGQELAQGGKLF